MSIANRWGLPLALLLAFFLVAPATPAWSEDETEETTEETEEVEGATIEWVEGFAEGQKVATAEGKLMFVYFGRKSPT